MPKSPKPTSITPLHRPTYNIHLSSAQINSIITNLFPKHTITRSHELESGKSFNNRIYFIDVEPEPLPTSSPQFRETYQRKLVLKVSGHYFDKRKVENEAGALLLLEKYCPSVPAPRVVAWSGDGKVIQTVDGVVCELTDDNAHGESTSGGGTADTPSNHSWILITRCPGRVLTAADLDGVHGPVLMREIAGHLATWRNSMPRLTEFGSLRLRGLPDKELEGRVTLYIPKPGDGGGDAYTSFAIGEPLLCQQYEPPPIPMSTPLSYWMYLAKDQYFHQQNFAALKSLHDKIGAEVQQFVEDMPRLSFFQTQSDQEPPRAMFTHLDFAPRNILVTDSSDIAEQTQPHVTGILDFEFSAFLPFEEEFLNMQIRQGDDWTTSQTKMLVDELAKLGCGVPHLVGQFEDPVYVNKMGGECTCDSASFKGLCVLVDVIQNVAPWYIQEGSHGVEELEIEVEKAAGAVRKGIDDLKSFLL